MWLHLLVTCARKSASARHTLHDSGIEKYVWAGTRITLAALGFIEAQKLCEKLEEKKRDTHVCAGIRKRLAALGSSVRTALSARSRCKKKR